MGVSPDSTDTGPVIYKGSGAVYTSIGEGPEANVLQPDSGRNPGASWSWWGGCGGEENEDRNNSTHSVTLIPSFVSGV
jgi:hypothetical protein